MALGAIGNIVGKVTHDVVHTAADAGKDVAKVAVQGAKDVAGVATATAGDVAGAAKTAGHDVGAAATSTVDNVKELAGKGKMILSGIIPGTKTIDYHDTILKNSVFSKDTLHQNPQTAADFQASMQKLGIDPSKCPQTEKLLTSLDGYHLQNAETGSPNDSDYLSQEGYASLEELAKSKGQAGMEQLAGQLDNYVDTGKGDPDFKKQIAADGLRDVAFPTTIAQGGKDICGAMVVQQMWAHDNPSDYLNGLTTLAQGNSYTLKSGKTLSPLSDSLTDSNDDRPASVKVLGDAIALYAQKTDPARGVVNGVAGALHIPHQGLTDYDPATQPNGVHTPGEIADTLNDITGEHYHTKILNDMSSMDNNLAQGQTVPLLISGGAKTDWHWVQAIGADPRPDKSPMIRLSSWGGEYLADQNDLQNYTRVALVQDDPGPDQKITQSTNNDRVGP